MGSSINALNSRRRIRRNFGSITEVAEMPNLIDVQKEGRVKKKIMDNAGYKI
jgi:hypothetical protein